jgi:hypothetical protein
MFTLVNRGKMQGGEERGGKTGIKFPTKFSTSIKCTICGENWGDSNVAGPGNGSVG